MRISTMTKRVTNLENKWTHLRLGQNGRCRSGEQMDDASVPVLTQLQKLAQETRRIRQQTDASGDLHTALACISEHRRILELICRLRGDLDESPTNIVNVNLDSATARRIAETYLDRHKPEEVESK